MYRKWLMRLVLMTRSTLQSVLRNSLAIYPAQDSIKRVNDYYILLNLHYFLPDVKLEYLILRTNEEYIMP